MEFPKSAQGCGDLVDVTRLRDWRWEMIWPCPDGPSGKHGVLLARGRGEGHVMRWRFWAQKLPKGPGAEDEGCHLQEVDEVTPGPSGGSTDPDPVFQPRETELWFPTSDLCGNRHAPGLWEPGFVGTRGCSARSAHSMLSV